MGAWGGIGGFAVIRASLRISASRSCVTARITIQGLPCRVRINAPCSTWARTWSRRSRNWSSSIVMVFIAPVPWFDEEAWPESLEQGRHPHRHYRSHGNRRRAAPRAAGHQRRCLNFDQGLAVSGHYFGVVGQLLVYRLDDPPPVLNSPPSASPPPPTPPSPRMP